MELGVKMLAYEGYLGSTLVSVAWQARPPQLGELALIDDGLKIALMIWAGEGRAVGRVVTLKVASHSYNSANDCYVACVGDFRNVAVDSAEYDSMYA